MLGLPIAQDAPISLKVTPPATELRPPLHFQVKVTSALQQGETAEITLERITASWPSGSSVLTASEFCPEVALLERAGAICADHHFADEKAAADRARNLLATFPGARVAFAAVEAACVVVAVGDALLIARTTAPASVAGRRDALVVDHTSSHRPTTIRVHTGPATGTLVIDTFG